MDTKRNYNQDGFSLMELTVVVIVVGILASLAIPRYNTVIERTRSAEGVELLNTLKNLQWVYYYENNSTFAEVLADLDATFPTPSNFDALDNDSIDSGAGEIAIVERSTGNYTLAIDSAGVITCDDISGTLCGKLGY